MRNRRHCSTPAVARNSVRPGSLVESDAAAAMIVGSRSRRKRRRRMNEWIATTQVPFEVSNLSKKVDMIVLAVS